MIPAPFAPTVAAALLVYVALFAMVAAGLVMMFGRRRLAGRLILISLFLAVVAGLVPQYIH